MTDSTWPLKTGGEKSPVLSGLSYHKSSLTTIPLQYSAPPPLQAIDRQIRPTKRSSRSRTHTYEKTLHMETHHSHNTDIHAQSRTLRGQDTRTRGQFGWFKSKQTSGFFLAPQFPQMDHKRATVRHQRMSFETSK